MRFLCKLGIHKYTIREVHPAEPFLDKDWYQAWALHRCEECSNTKEVGSEMLTAIVASTKFLPENFTREKMRLPEQTEVDGVALKIWTNDEGVCISDDGGWIDGIYENRDAAIMGFKLSRSDEVDGWSELSDLSNRVCATPPKRNLTVADFEQAEGEMIKKHKLRRMTQSAVIEMIEETDSWCKSDEVDGMVSDFMMLAAQVPKKVSDHIIKILNTDYERES
ncbi:MAG: hypothetical protein V3W52_17365 [Syntrophobacteria bacterium]